MRKYKMLVNNKQEQQEEGNILHYKLEGNVALEHLREIEAKPAEMRTKLNNDRTQRWTSWVDNSWGHTKKDIYKWIRGKT
eukprot:13777241-Heterocapsa_arctica.AAC.1